MAQSESILLLILDQVLLDLSVVGSNPASDSMQGLEPTSKEKH